MIRFDLNDKTYILNKIKAKQKFWNFLQEIERLRLSCDNCHFEWNTKLKFFPMGAKNSKESFSNTRCPACKSGISVTMKNVGELEIHGAKKV